MLRGMRTRAEQKSVAEAIAPGCICLRSLIFRVLWKTLHIGIHCFCDNFGMSDRFHNSARAVDNVTAGENFRTGGVAFLVCFEKSAAVGFQTLGRIDQFVSRSLADGDDDAVGGDTVFLFRGSARRSRLPFPQRPQK